MDSPGSLETQATESYYYVTPVEDSWTAAQAEEWLSNFNYDTLRIVSIHEVYPGHFVHHLHNTLRAPAAVGEPGGYLLPPLPRAGRITPKR